MSLRSAIFIKLNRKNSLIRSACGGPIDIRYLSCWSFFFD
jgi:hypothetical protein